jgi:hypothetical protein
MIGFHQIEKAAQAQEALEIPTAAAADPATVVQQVQRTLTAPPPTGARGREHLEHGE